MLRVKRIEELQLPGDRPVAAPRVAWAAVNTAPSTQRVSLKTLGGPATLAG